MTALIFGANGQDGYYLTELLQKQGVIVYGVSRTGDFLRTSIENFKEVESLIQAIKPDYIFHLAANSTTRHEAIFENHQTISTGTLNILESVRLHSSHTKVFISGSGLQFQNKDLPISESDPFEARDIYSVSRIQSVYASRYFRTLGIRVYVGYFFNHDSPRRSERHMAKKISAAAKRISEGSSEILEIGDLSVIKEWTFAGDIAKGIWLLVNQEDIFEANVSSGKGYSIQEWVEACFGVVDLDSRKFTREIPGFRSEYRVLVSDPKLIMSLGFNPAIDFLSLAEMMVKK